MARFSCRYDECDRDDVQIHFEKAGLDHADLSNISVQCSCGRPMFPAGDDLDDGSLLQSVAGLLTYSEEYGTVPA